MLRVLQFIDGRERATKGPRDGRHMLQRGAPPFNVHVADLRDDHGRGSNPLKATPAERNASTAEAIIAPRKPLR